MARITAEEIDEICATALPWVAFLGFQVEVIGEGRCRVRMPHRKVLLRPGGSVSGPS